MEEIKKDKGFRLLEMYETLENNGSFNVDELTKKNKVSKKTVHRDLSDLRTFYAEQGYCGEDVVIYNKSKNSYHLNKSHKQKFSLEQGLLLFQLISNCNFINYQEKISILKVMEAMVDQQTIFKEQCYKLTMNEKSCYESFKQSYHAIINQRQLAFFYHKHYFQINPIDFISAFDTIYLIAVNKENDWMVFDLQDMKQISSLDQKKDKVIYHKDQIMQDIQVKINKITFEVLVDDEQWIKERIPCSKVIEKGNQYHVMEAVLLQEQLFQHELTKKMNKIKRIK